MAIVDRSIKVAGVASYQDGIWASVLACDSCARTHPGPCRSDGRYVQHIVPVTLFAESDNHTDALAVSIWAQHVELGHLARGTTRALHGLLSQRGPIQTEARVYGLRVRDDMRGTLGVRLDDVSIFTWQRDPWFATSGPRDVRIYTSVPV